jgi:hypothetical protein
MARLSSWLAAVFFAAYLVLGYFYLKQRAEMALVRAEASEATAREQQSRRQATEFRQKLAAADDAAKKAEEELAAQDQAATARTKASAAANRNRVINLSDIAKDHPEYAELQRKQMRRTLLRQYGDSLAALNLPPDQLVQLKDLLMSRSFSADDPRLAGLERGTPAYNQAMRAASEAATQQIDALIGPDGQRKLQDAQMLTTAQNQVANTYAPDFQEAGAPLTPEQSAGLAQLLNPRNGLGGGRAMNEPDPATWLSPRDTALLEQAAQVLSPAQLSIFKSDRADQNHMQSIMRSYLPTGGQANFGTTTIISGR